MAAKTEATLISDIAAAVLSGGRRTTAANVRSLLADILDSYANIVDGGQIYQAEVGYSTVFTPTQNTSFVTKKWVTDNFASATGLGSLTQTLAIGNNTGAYDVVIDADQQVKFGSGAAGITHQSVFVDPNHLIIHTHSSLTKSYLLLSDGANSWSDQTASGFISIASGASNAIQLDTTNDYINVFAGAGGFNLYGGTYLIGGTYGGKNASDTLIINSTSHATKGKIYLGSASGLTYNENSGTLSIGNDSQTLTIAGVTYDVGFSCHNDAGTFINNEIHAASNTATLGAIQVGTRSRGTYGTPLVVANGDNLFDVYSVGYDGTDYAIATGIEHEVDGAVGANQVPGRIKFSTANSAGTLTQAMRINSSQQVSIGNYATPSAQRLVTIGQDTAFMSFGSLVGTTSSWAIYGNQAVPSASVAFLYGTSNNTFLNAISNVYISVSGATQSIYALGTQVHSPFATSSGTTTPFTFTVGANTGQTASTEIPNFKVTGNTKTWANGGGATTITNQRWNYLTANTAATSGGGSLTITNSYGFYAEAAVASGVTITNNYAAGFSGSVRVIGRVVKNQGADVASANNLVLGSDGNVFEITGTTQINLISNIAWENGSQVTLLFTSTPTVKHNQATSTTNITIQLAGAVDFVATAGDTLTLCLCEIGGTQAWREISRAVI